MMNGLKSVLFTAFVALGAMSTGCNGIEEEPLTEIPGEVSQEVVQVPCGPTRTCTQSVGTFCCQTGEPATYVCPGSNWLCTDWTTCGSKGGTCGKDNYCILPMYRDCVPTW